MKSTFVIAVLAGLVIMMSRCYQVNNIKDLDENMLDMMAYHDNLGLYLRNENADYSLWLLDGMDSSLQVIADKFTTHRKLHAPFKKYYKKLLQPPINGIRSALEQNNFPRAIEQYRVLTNKCNDCHIDHEIDKDVIDWSRDDIH